MGKAFAGFLIAFVIMSVFSGFMAGGDGYAIATLTAPMTSSATTADVSTTGGFLSSGATFWIDNERMSYADGSAATQFTGITRGIAAENGKATQAAAHQTGAKVYTDDANAVSYALGFDWAKTIGTAGIFSVVVIPSALLFVTIPHLGAFNFVFLQGDLWLIGVLFFASFAGMMITFSINMLGGASSIVRP